MKHKITVITNEQGKVVGAVRNEMNVQGQVISFHPSPHSRNKYHSLEVEEELLSREPESLVKELSTRLKAS